MRNLASVQKILDLQPIPNADAIEVATVLGWKVVVKKNEFKVGFACVYCEIDSVFPDKPEFEFLRNKGFRCRTIKLRGQVSQGICFPLSILPPNIEVIEGTDVTELLGVTKYDPPVPACLSGMVKGNFPSWISKTDETRVQAFPQILERYKGMEFRMTEKVDGSSCTMYLKDDEFGVCSRNLDLKETADNSFWQVARKLNVEDRLRHFKKTCGVEAALQGELIGPGVNKNALKLKELDFRVFNWFEIGAGTYRPVITDEVMLYFGLNTVPYLGDIVLNHTVDELVKVATHKSTINPDVWLEGIVFRPTSLREYNIHDVDLGRLSFKVINPEYLLKYE